MPWGCPCSPLPTWAPLHLPTLRKHPYSLIRESCLPPHNHLPCTAGDFHSAARVHISHAEPTSLLPPRPYFLLSLKLLPCVTTGQPRDSLPCSPSPHVNTSCFTGGNQSFSDGGMVLGALHKVTVRFFHTWSRLSPVDEDPYGERGGLSEGGAVLESGAHGARQVDDRKNERNGDSGSIGQCCVCSSF